MLDHWLDEDYRADMLALRRSRGFRHKISAAMTKLWSNEIYKKAQSLAIKRGKKKLFYRKAESERKRISHNDPSFKRKMSLLHRLAYAKGERKIIAGGKYVSTIKGGEIICHGDPNGNQNEFMFAYILDVLDFVKSYKKDYLRIPYKYKGKKHTYFPDFYTKMTNGMIVVFEISGWLNPKGVLRLQAGKRYCKEKGWQFVVLSNKDTSDLDGMINLVVQLRKKYGHKRST